MKEISISEETLVPFTRPSVRRLARQRVGLVAPTTEKKSSLMSLMSEVRKGERQESLVWLVLALSAAVLTALSFWI